MKADRLSPVQIMTLTVGAIFGVDVLTMQNSMVKIARQDGWIPLLLGGILAIFAAANMYYLAKLYPDKDLPRIMEHVAGKFIGKLILFFFLAYVLLYAGLSLRIFAQVLKMFLLDRTPIYAIVTLMVLTVVYPVYKGIYTIGGVIDIIFPLCKITMITIILLSLPLAEPSNAKPILFENTGSVIRGILPGYQQFTGYGVIAYILCYTQKPKGTFKWYMIGVIIPVVLYTALLIVTIMVFTAPGIDSLVYPTLILSKSIEFPATFLERFEAFIAVFWIGIVYESITLFTFASVRNFTVFFNLGEKRHKLVSYAHIPLLIVIALVVKRGPQVLEYLKLIKYMVPLLGLVITPALTVLALLKKRKEGKA